MKQYLFSVYGVDGEPTPSTEETQQSYTQVDQLNKELVASGNWVFAGGLFPPQSATVVRVENGTRTTTDGPFAEAKEHVGGFWVLKCADLDEALAVAERCAQACMSPIEVRPFQDEPEE